MRVLDLLLGSNLHYHSFTRNTITKGLRYDDKGAKEQKHDYEGVTVPSLIRVIATLLLCDRVFAPTRSGRRSKGAITQIWS